MSTQTNRGVQRGIVIDNRTVLAANRTKGGDYK